MTSYIRCFLQYARYKAAAALAMMVLLGLLEGSGLLLLLPLLTLLGLGDGHPDNFVATAIPTLLRAFRIPFTLPIVLGLFVLFMSGQLWLRRWLDVFVARMENGFVVQLRAQLYEAMVHADWLFFTRQRGSEVTQVLTDEVDRIGSGTQQMLSLLSTAAVGLVQLAFAFLLAPGLTALAICCGGLLLLADRPVTRRTEGLGEEAQEKRLQMTSAITEHLGGMKVAKSQGREGRHLAHFYAVITDIAAHAVELVRVWAGSRARYEIGAVLALSFFLYFATTFTRLRSTELLLFLFIFTRFLPRISTVQGSWLRLLHMLPSFAAWKRLRDQFLQAQEPPWPQSARPLPLQNEIRFEAVSFAYDERSQHAAIRDVNLVIPAGQTTAVCGRSGAGKSTLADILMGLFQPSAGRVLIDNTPLAGENIHHWRRSVGYVPQEPFLFNETVRANLLWAQPTATEEDLRAALRASAAEEFVDRLPAGLDTLVGDRGVRLSGGERQRLTMARALLAQPSILILDEATSSLDTENERLIQEAIQRLHGELTVVVIAHRLSTVRNADAIIVLNRGEIVEQGTWQSLLSRPGSLFAGMVQAGAQ
jgi:ATP-binding cassette, subfamily C, bacterial